MPKPPPPKPGDKKKPERKNYVELPEEFDVPKIEVGETFEFVAEVRRMKDGYCIVSADGVPTDKEKDEPEDEEEQESIGSGARKAMEGGY